MRFVEVLIGVQRIHSESSFVIASFSIPVLLSLLPMDQGLTGSHHGEPKSYADLRLDSNPRNAN